jgi:hypothetical protein
MPRSERPADSSVTSPTLSLIVCGCEGCGEPIRAGDSTTKAEFVKALADSFAFATTLFVGNRCLE